MSEPNLDLRLEIAHVLFIDIVGSSKLLINEQSELLRELNQVVRNADQVRAAEMAGKLIRLPTGDGMALVFFSTPDAPVRCALEISKALRPLGDSDSALPLIEHSLSSPRGISVPTLRLDPVWDPLRHDPRFEKLLAKFTAPSTKS